MKVRISVSKKLDYEMMGMHLPIASSYTQPCMEGTVIHLLAVYILTNV